MGLFEGTWLYRPPVVVSALFLIEHAYSHFLHEGLTWRHVLDVHESLHGLKAKFQLAGNYWRARWKYKLFTDMTWMRALLEWVLGALFERQPRLG